MICAHERPRIAFGPAFPGVGSWEWIGADMADELSDTFETLTFDDEVPDCDLVVNIKYPLPMETVQNISRRAAFVFCPVDFFGSCAEIDRMLPLLRRTSRVIVHCGRLRKYFQSYARTQVVDHHVKYIPDSVISSSASGDGLWVGMRSNLPPLVEWVNRHPLPGKLRVLTNLGQRTKADPGEFGFRDPHAFTIESWTGERHRQAASEAGWAIDVKGDDFRQRNKPATKVIDFVASGLPVAVNTDSSSAERLAELGFRAAGLDEPERWTSDEYRTETEAFGARLRTLLSRRQVAQRFREIFEDVLAEHEKGAVR